MSVFMKAAVWGGIAVMIVTASVVGGIVTKVINDGDHHKEHMTTLPPPSPPPAARRMTEHEEIYGQRGSHFDLTKEERKMFTTLAARKAMEMKR